MGVTLHIAKPSLTFKAKFNGDIIDICVAPFAAMAKDYNRHSAFRDEKSDTTRSCDIKFAAVERAKKKGWKPEYMMLTFGSSKEKYSPDGHYVYRVSEHSNGYYDAEMGDQHRPIIGLVVKIGKEYSVIPYGEPVHTWIKTNFPKQYDDWNASHIVWQRINKNYKATVQCIGDLERYIYSNPKQVDLELFNYHSPEQRGSTPNWMIEGINSLKKQFYNERKNNQ